MIVFDSSALLALARQEAGATVVAQGLSQGHVSAVNVSEFVQKLEHYGAKGVEAFEMLEGLGLRLHDITREDAYQAAKLYDVGKPYGLSLGDRLCLALAQRLEAEVVTADQVWLKLAKKLKLTIRSVR